MLVQSRIFTPVSFSKISKTKDGGDTWTETRLGDKWGNDFEFIPGDASKVFFTDGYDLYFSIDTGSIWTEIVIDTSDLDSRDIVFTDKYHGWILCDNGNIYKTSTGGIPNYQPVDYIAANEILMWVGNNGMNSHDPRNDASGFLLAWWRRCNTFSNLC